MSHLEEMYRQDYERARGQVDAFLYMWGSLSAAAAKSPTVRRAMLDAIRLAEEGGYLDHANADDARAKIDQWRARAEYR